MTQTKHDASPAKVKRPVPPATRAKMSDRRREWWAKQVKAAPAEADASTVPTQNATAPDCSLEPSPGSPIEEAQRPAANHPSLEPGHAEAPANGGDGTASDQAKTSGPAEADSQRQHVLARIVYKSIGLPYPYDHPEAAPSKNGETNPTRQPSKPVERATDMTMSRTPQPRRNKPVIETDFVRGDAALFELVR